MARAYTEARARSNKKYDAKTYKKFTINLRIEDDADIIESLEKAKENGYTSRQWLNLLWKKRFD